MPVLEGFSTRAGAQQRSQCTRLQVRIQVVPLAQLQHGAEAVVINLEHVEQAYDADVLHALHDAVLARLGSARAPSDNRQNRITQPTAAAHRVAHVAALVLLLPRRQQLVHLAGDVPPLLHIVRLCSRAAR